MSRFRRSCLAALILMSACHRNVDVTPTPAPDPAQQVTALADSYVEAYFAAFPYQALLFGAPDVRPRELADHSLEALRRWQGEEDRMLAALREINATTLEDQPEAVTYDFLKNQLETAVEFRACHMELWNVSPTWTGWQADFALLASMQPTTTDAQRDAAFERFSRIPDYIDTEIANLREGVRLGYTAPASNVRAVVGQMDALLEAPLTDSPFVEIAGDSLPSFGGRLQALVANYIRPAIARYRDYLRDEYIAAAREAVGVDANPEGSACYLAAIRYYTTLRMTPQTIHALGLQQMEEIRAEMQTIGEGVFGVSEPESLLQMVKTDPKYRFKSRRHMIEYAQAAVQRAHDAVPEYFGRLPKASVVVEPFPEFQEKNAPGGFAVPPSKDGSKPGKYLINTYKAEEQSIAGLEATAFHETYPGHHLQGAIALEREGLHPILQYFYLSGYGEGWALYSERLADEMQLYSSDIDRLGLLSNEALRAGRLVVDTGMHALGWSRQRAIEYLLANTAETRSGIEAEIDRYIAVPGQATSYMIGNLEIRRLRRQAEEALGVSFDIRAFHDIVLEDGSVPLWVLRRKVETWIGRQR